MITIHVIFHAHLDPIWMWPWTAGLDEAIATSRSACDRLDAHPDLFYTQGEAWAFDAVERTDPELFARIRAHVAAGRWEVAGGWWTQPDCNFPTREGFDRQLEAGLTYVKDRFGLAPRCAFNPDSFGHAAILPEVMRDHGQDRYVYMRPEKGSTALPARLFSWRSRPDGRPVSAFRIADCYNNGQDGVWEGGFTAAMAALPAGCNHTMAFMGVGNHGGGPTEYLVRWVREHREHFPGARLEFSTLNRFFDAVAQEGTVLPEVAGELQRSCLGCYTVVRPTKVAVRRAEHLLVRAETVVAADEKPELARAWQAVASHHFHDTLGGTCLPEAYRFIDAELGGAAATGERILAHGLRRYLSALRPDPLPRLVLANPGAPAFAGWCESVVYVEGAWRGPWRLLDEAGTEVPYQVMHNQAGIDPTWPWGLRRVLLHTTIPADGYRVLRLDLSAPPTPPAAAVEVGETALSNSAGLRVELAGRRPVLSLGTRSLPLALHLLDDPGNTWGHGGPRHELPLAEPVWQPPRILDRGPLMAALRQEGTLGSGRVTAEWRLHAGSSAVDLLLEVAWLERSKVLKLVLPVDGAKTRSDGVPGMALERANGGIDDPLQDWTSIGSLGVVCPDAFALDATPERVRFVLLRSAFMADFGGGGFPRAAVSDQGVHSFRFRFYLAPRTPEQLAAKALAMQRPPLTVEMTRGMPARFTDYKTATEFRA